MWFQPPWIGPPARKIDYILGARERSSKEVRESVLCDDGVAVPLTIPRQKGETDLAVKEVKVGGRRYIVCRNEEEARKDAETRATLLAGLHRKLAGGAKGLVGNTGYRRFRVVLRTSLAMSALAVVLRYRNPTDGRTELPRRKSFADHPPGVPSHRCRDPWTCVLHILALVLRKELLDRLAAAPRRRAGMAMHH
jgi:hypothetical protein